MESGNPNSKYFKCLQTCCDGSSLKLCKHFRVISFRVNRYKHFHLVQIILYSWVLFGRNHWIFPHRNFPQWKKSSLHKWFKLGQTKKKVFFWVITLFFPFVHRKFEPFWPLQLDRAKQIRYNFPKKPPVKRRNFLSKT